MLLFLLWLAVVLHGETYGRFAFPPPVSKVFCTFHGLLLELQYHTAIPTLNEGPIQDFFSMNVGFLFACWGWLVSSKPDFNSPYR